MMNDRIWELIQEAGFYTRGDRVYIPTTSEDITELQEKLAELIIKECAAIINKELYCDSSPLANKLKKHFGVE